MKAIPSLATLSVYVSVIGFPGYPSDNIIIIMLEFRIMLFGITRFKQFKFNWIIIRHYTGKVNVRVKWLMCEWLLKLLGVISFYSDIRIPQTKPFKQCNGNQV